LVVLYCGGTKKRQQADIATALTLHAEYQARKKVARRASGSRTRKGERMALTRDFKETVVARVRRDPKFARALLDESATLFLSGEPKAARLLLRDLVNATIGFEALAEMTDTPAKSLHRMLSRSGNPSMDNLAAIFDAVSHRLKVGLKAQTVKAA
jgi:DNA-binding phage protein